jgi:thioredoxin 1
MNAFFHQLLSKHSYTLIDFHATWCEPCKWVEPIVNDIVKHFEGKLSLEKIDIDEHPDLARELHVLSVPTIVLYKGNEELWRIRGFDTLPRMIAQISEHISA